MIISHPKIPLLLLCAPVQLPVHRYRYRQIHWRWIPAFKSGMLQFHKQQEDLSKQYDFGDLLRSIFLSASEADPNRNRSGITVAVPKHCSQSYYRFAGGIKSRCRQKTGNDPKHFSVAATSASITTKASSISTLIITYLRPATNGTCRCIVVAKTVSPDYGLGIGRRHQQVHMQIPY